MYKVFLIGFCLILTGCAASKKTYIQGVKDGQAVYERKLPGEYWEGFRRGFMSSRIKHYFPGD